MKYVLEIKNFSKSYSKGKKAVESLNLNVSKGEIHGFIGHNGAGKTTVIRSVAGIMDFDEGDILIDGHSVKTEPVLCKELTAYIPDNPDLYEYITGLQYLNYIADIFRVTKADREERISMYSDIFSISNKLGDLIGSYSHGMKQKTAIVGALIHNPKLLILDEPFVGLDPEASFHLKNIMREMCSKGSGIFFSTHVLEVAQKLCDRISIIKHGKLISSGKTDEIAGKQSLEDVFMEDIENDK